MHKPKLKILTTKKDDKNSKIDVDQAIDKVFKILESGPKAPKKAAIIIEKMLKGML